MPEQGMSLEAWRARKGAAAPSSGGGMSLEAWRAQKAQAAPPAPPKPTFAPGADEAVMALPTMPTPSLGPNLGAVRGLGPARTMEPTAPPVRLDDMGPMEELMMRRVLPIASRAMEGTATGIQAPIEDQFKRMQAEVANQKLAGRGFLTGVPAAVANQIVPGSINAASSAMAALGAPLAPLGAAGQIIDEREGYRDARTGQIVPGSGTPGLALSEKMGRREPTLGEMLTRIGRAPENVLGQVSTVGRSIARVPATLAGADPEDETSASPLAQTGSEIAFGLGLGAAVPAIKGRLASASAAAERGALARGLAATPEALVRSADLMPDRPVAPQTFKPLRVPADAALDAGGKPSVSVKPQTSTGTAAAPAEGVAIVGRKGVRRFTDGAQAQEFAKTRGLSVTERTAGDGSGRVWYEVETPSAKPSPVASPESSPLVASTQTPDAPATSAQPAPPAPPRPTTGEAVPPEVARQAVGGVEAIPPERPLKPSPPRSGRGKASVPERPFVPPEPEAPQPVGVSAVGGEPVAPAKVGAASRPEKPFSSKPAAVRPSDAALGGAKPELVPPPGEGTVPTRGERAIEAQGGPEAVAAKTGRVVVEQADGTKLLVAEAERPRAEALAEQGKLAEFVNGEGTSPKPAAPTEAVIARDASGAEVRTVLTDTPEKTASAVAAQEAQGLKVEVVPANEGTIGKVLAERETPAPAPEAPANPGAAGKILRLPERNATSTAKQSANRKTVIEEESRAAFRTRLSDEFTPDQIDRIVNRKRDLDPYMGPWEAQQKAIAETRAKATQDAKIIEARFGAKPTTPEIEALKRRRDTAEGALADAAQKGPAAVSRVKDEIARINSEISNRSTGEATNPIEALKDRRNALEDRWSTSTDPSETARIEAELRDIGVKIRESRRGAAHEPSQSPTIAPVTPTPAPEPAPAPKGRLKGPRSPGAKGAAEVKYGNGGETQMRSGFSPQDVVDAAKAVASAAENVVKATIDRFEKDYGKAGRALADELLNVKVQRDINVGKVFTDSNLEYGKLGRGERAEVSKNLRSWVEGKTVVPAKFAPLVKEVRASLSTMADVLDESGVRVADEGGPRKIHRVGETYFPRAFDQDWLKAIREENKPGHTGPTPLTAEWRAMNGNTTDNPWLPKPTVSRSRLDPSFYSANELPRKFKYPDKALAEDQWAAFEQHVQRSSANAAEHRVFQYRDLAGGGSKSLGRLEQLVEAAAQENKKGENPQAARGAVEDMTLHALGRHESVFGDSWTKKLAEGEALYQSGTKLAVNPFNIAQQISQMVNNATVLGNRMTATFTSKLFVDTMKKLSRLEDPRGPWNEATAKAQRKGVIRPEAYSTALDLTEGTPGKVVQNARRVVRTLSRGSEWLDRLGRLTTAEVAPEALGKLEAGLKAGGKEAAASERFMREVRMSESDIAALRDGTASELVRRKFEILLNGMVNIEGGAMMRPKWVNSLDNFAPGAGQIAYRFKNYPVQQMKVAKYAIKEAANGNFRPAVRMATWTIVHGEALAKLREALWGEDEQRKDWDEIIENRDWGALSYRLGQDVALSGTMGMAGSFIPPLLGKDKSGRTMATAEKQMTPPIASSARNYWAAAKDAMGRKTMTEDGPRFRNGRPDRPMDREDAFWQELDELVRREVPAYRTVREHTDDTPTDSRSRKR